MTKDGEGECVGGIAMMLKGANANVVTKELEARVERVQKNVAGRCSCRTLFESFRIGRPKYIHRDP